MYAVLKSFGLKGLNGFPVEVEADISGGMPALSIVGLPDSAVRESGDRVHAALKNLGFKWPDRRITINLAPADVRKTGPVYDLPLLLAVLASIAAVIINYLVTHWDEIKQNFSQTLADLAQALNTAEGHGLSGGAGAGRQSPPGVRRPAHGAGGCRRRCAGALCPRRKRCRSR